MFNKAFTNALYISYKPLMPSTFGLPGCENYLLQVKPFNQHPLNLSTFSTADFLESLIFFINELQTFIIALLLNRKGNHLPMICFTA